MTNNNNDALSAIKDGNIENTKEETDFRLRLDYEIVKGFFEAFDVQPSTRQYNKKGVELALILATNYAKNLKPLTDKISSADSETDKKLSELMTYQTIVLWQLSGEVALLRQLLIRFTRHYGGGDTNKAAEIMETTLEEFRETNNAVRTRFGIEIDVEKYNDYDLRMDILTGRQDPSSEQNPATSESSHQEIERD